jgi:mannitol/fructose-specific phosphotransferase system IIA component (Ntr-type)
LELDDFVPADAIVFRLHASDAPGAIRELASALARAHGLDKDLAETLMLAREHLGSMLWDSPRRASTSRHRTASRCGLLSPW